MADRQYSRQLATIVSIDAVGFSRLMGIDDEGALVTFEERRNVIADSCASFGGRTFGAAGDSVMAEFGNPIEALRAAFDFQARIGELNEPLPEDRRMRFRAEINTGDVIVHDDNLYGDDVNIAARIQEFAPRDGLAISETTWHHVKDKTTAAFTDLGTFALKNIALPVRVFIAERDSERGMTSAVTSLVAGYRPLQNDARRGGPPAIAVLAFRNDTGDRELDYIADGIAEDIINGLSSTRWVSVIAKSSSFQFRDNSLGIGVIGNLLGARYVVSGRLASGGRRIRLSTALADASNGRQIWSRRFEHDFNDMFDLQDEVGNEIVSMLENEVDKVEQVRTFQVPWESLETWQLVRRGRWHMQRRTRMDTDLALNFFQKAYVEDPNSSAVLNELAWWYFWRAWLHFGDSRDLDKVTDYARRSLLVDSQDARPYAYLGVTDIMRGKPKSAIEHLQQALHINPSFAFAHSATGSGHLLLCQPQQAIPSFLDADRLSPFDMYRFHNLGELAAAYCFVQNWDQAIEAADRSLNLSPGYFYSRFLKIGALKRKGRHEDAAQEMQIFQTRHPDFSHKKVEWIPFVEKSANRLLIDNFELGS